VDFVDDKLPIVIQGKIYKYQHHLQEYLVYHIVVVVVEDNEVD
jgi:hypothetical protein